MVGCIKSPDAIKQLPPTTQEGKNTFGFKLNGAIWLPGGNNGTANLDAIYDPTYHGGSLGINAYLINNSTHQLIAFGGNNISSTGNYILAAGSDLPGAIFSDYKVGCSYNNDDDNVIGHFVLEKLDLVNGIVAGTFEFTFQKADCSMTSVTEGRFDVSLQ